MELYHRFTRSFNGKPNLKRVSALFASHQKLFRHGQTALGLVAAIIIAVLAHRSSGQNAIDEYKKINPASFNQIKALLEGMKLQPIQDEKILRSIYRSLGKNSHSLKGIWFDSELPIVAYKDDLSSPTIFVAFAHPNLVIDTKKLSRKWVFIENNIEITQSAQKSIEPVIKDYEKSATPAKTVLKARSYEIHY